MPEVKIEVSLDVWKQKTIFTSKSKIWKLYSAVGGEDGVRLDQNTGNSLG